MMENLKNSDKSWCQVFKKDIESLFVNWKMIFVKFVLATLMLILLLNAENNFSLRIYLILSSVLFFVLMMIFIRNDRKLFIQILGISLGTTFTYAFFNGYSLNYILENIWESSSYFRATILYTIMLIILFLRILFGSVRMRIIDCAKKRSLKREEISYQELFENQVNNLNRLESYLEKFNIVGVNGEWGIGKTFMINEFKRVKESKYEFVTIDLLSCNLDEVQSLILKKIGKVLFKNGIFSEYLDDLSRMLGKDNILKSLVDMLFTSSPTYATTLTKFKEEVSCLDNAIIIVFEDIDRISEPNIIKKILGISEHLSDEKIKFVYQYSQNKLEEVKLLNGKPMFNREYIEKYIPHYISVTEYGFQKMFNEIAENLYNNGEIGSEFDINYLKTKLLNDKPLLMNFSKAENTFENISYRKIENCVKEIDNILTLEDWENSEKETVITFYVLKHFLPNIISKIKPNVFLQDSLKFQIKNEGTIYKYVPDIELGCYRKIVVNEEFDALESQENLVAVYLLELYYCYKEKSDIINDLLWRLKTGTQIDGVREIK